jgi:PAS domain S-box-containing protein
MVPEKLIGSKCYEIVHHTQAEIDACPHRRMLTTHKFERLEFFDPHLQKWLDVTTTPIFDENNNLMGSIHIAFDVTERKSIEQEKEEYFKEILEQKDYLELIYKVAPHATFTVDINHAITGWNHQAEIITGFSAEEVMWKNCKGFPLHPCREKCGLFSSDVAKPIIAKECVIERKDGQHRFILKNADLIRDKEGNVVGGIETFEDITYRKTMEAQRDSMMGELMMRNQALSSFHDFAQLIEQSGISLEGILQGALTIIPRAFMYPESACTRIILGKKVFAGEKCTETPWRLENHMVINNEKIGSVQVFYRQEKMTAQGTPFTREEQTVLFLIAERLGRVVERFRQQEALVKANMELEEKNKQLREML